MNKFKVLTIIVLIIAIIICIVRCDKKKKEPEVKVSGVEETPIPIVEIVSEEESQLSMDEFETDDYKYYEEENMGINDEIDIVEESIELFEEESSSDEITNVSQEKIIENEQTNLEELPTIELPKEEVKMSIVRLNKGESFYIVLNNGDILEIPNGSSNALLDGVDNNPNAIIPEDFKISIDDNNIKIIEFPESYKLNKPKN